MAYIYKITNLINGKEYIGKTELTIKERFRCHIKDSQTKKCEKRPLYSAFNKYGIENFKIELIEECPVEKLSEREQYWISFYDTYHNGYNATLGGDGKAYIDYDNVLKLYNSGLTLTEIANKINHDSEWISKILQSKGITQEEIIKRGQDSQKKQIACYNKKTNEYIKTFNSVTEGSQWVKDNNYSTDTVKGIISHVCQCANGIRKSAYGFIWKYIGS